MNTLALKALVRKDLLEFITDRRALIMAVVAPIMLASFFALILGGSLGGGGEASQIDIRVADEDSSEQSKKILRAIEEDEGLNLITGTAAEAREAVRKGSVVVAVVIPKGFGAQASKSLFGPGKKPVLELLFDPTKQAELGMVRGMLTQHVMKVVSASAMSPDSPTFAAMETDIDSAKDMTPELRDSLKSMFREVKRVQAHADASKKKDGESSESSYGMGVPYETHEEAVTAGDMKQKQAAQSHAFGGMAVQFILFSAIEAGVGLLTERQRGVWKRLRAAAPLSRLVLLAARVISAAMIALIVTCIVFGFGAIFFGIRIQGGAMGIFGFLAVAGAYALTAATFGLLIAALGKTPQAARGVSILVVLVMVMLGGAWMPSSMFPPWLHSATAIIPTRWAVDGFDAATIRANTVVEMLGPAAALLGFAAVFGILAVARFRWEAD